MKFSIVVYAAPYSSEAAATAFNFTKTLLDQGHELYRLFFFGDGVHNANRLAVVAQDEVNLQQRWDQLITTHRLDAVVCVSSAIRRGLLDSQESERYELDAISVYGSSEIAGLGQLIDAVINSDRVVNFG
ncbi:MAG: sulfurtransferase complex subunit TusD [Proteobacteria bacterium]|nr:sulfurtransferase complex subunit TusD [Pseudomonadota bacterium]